MVLILPETAPRGSPPRMRGKVMGTVCEKLKEGITPAHAGKRML